MRSTGSMSSNEEAVINAEMSGMKVNQKESGKRKMEKIFTLKYSLSEFE